MTEMEGYVVVLNDLVIRNEREDIYYLSSWIIHQQSLMQIR
jgi:hypothetical protein